VTRYLLQAHQSTTARLPEVYHIAGAQQQPEKVSYGVRCDINSPSVDGMLAML
jgi:hypothetical protein